MYPTHGAMASFSTRFLGCKVSFADQQAIRERLLADGHTEVERRRRRRRRQHVLRHERGAREVAPGRLPRCAAAPKGLRHRVRGQALDGAFARPARERRRGRAAKRGDRRGRRRGRRCDRLRARRAPARSHPCIRQDPGRLLVLVRVLRDPARSRRDAQPRGRRGARRDPAPRRPGSPRDRAHGRQSRLLS